MSFLFEINHACWAVDYNLQCYGTKWSVIMSIKSVWHWTFELCKVLSRWQCYNLFISPQWSFPSTARRSLTSLLTSYFCHIDFWPGTHARAISHALPCNWCPSSRLDFCAGGPLSIHSDGFATRSKVLCNENFIKLNTIWIETFITWRDPVCPKGVAWSPWWHRLRLWVLPWARRRTGPYGVAFCDFLVAFPPIWAGWFWRSRPILIREWLYLVRPFPLESEEKKIKIISLVHPHFQMYYTFRIWYSNSSLARRIS